MGMPKQDRLLYILNLLRARKNLNATQLAEECGVTERSIYRDILAISEANIPIYYDNGYKLATENFLPPLNFSFEEYSCLKIALESSPLIDTGNSAKGRSIHTDYDGNSRRFSATESTPGAADMGADEYHPHLYTTGNPEP